MDYSQLCVPSTRSVSSQMMSTSTAWLSTGSPRIFVLALTYTFKTGTSQTALIRVWECISENERSEMVRAPTQNAQVSSYTYWYIDPSFSLYHFSHMYGRQSRSRCCALHMACGIAMLRKRLRELTPPVPKESTMDDVYATSPALGHSFLT